MQIKNVSSFLWTPVPVEDCDGLCEQFSVGQTFVVSLIRVKVHDMGGA